MRRPSLSTTTTAILLATFLTGCGYDKTWVATDLTQQTPKPATYDMPVQRSDTARAHQVLGDLSVSTRIKPNWASETTDESVIDAMKKEAIRRGADAIVNVRTTEHDAGGHTVLTVTGRLIRFTEPPAAASRG